ncbi:MAG: SAM-dependent methyltransferase [Candidatus Azotimanducaceae bacterium]|jgi:SAM-dependent methyltransferase
MECSRLDRWHTDLAGVSVLELGSGTALDLAGLLAITDSLVCSDIRRDHWLSAARVQVPFVQLDHAALLLFGEAVFDVVVAGLCLHYFSRAQTSDILQSIQHVLRPGGLLLGRVNSSRYVNHGAGRGEQIEPGYFAVPSAKYANKKRFFTENELLNLFSGWQVEHLEETAFIYCDYQKFAFEFALRRSID